ncbi:MAG TPA: hypothetical protein VJ485_04005 [archaeon]|jgi:hypothetical protein|nr:hypothetical protein [archaeon]
MKGIKKAFETEIDPLNKIVFSGVSCMQDLYEIGVSPKEAANKIFSNYRNRTKRKDLREYIENHSE